MNRQIRERVGLIAPFGIVIYPYTRFKFIL